MHSHSITPELIAKLTDVESSLDEINRTLMKDKNTRREGKEIKDLRITVSAIARNLRNLDKNVTVLR
jgi:hypothetical protein